MTAVSAAKRTTTTTTFTIDEQTGLPQEEAAAATATPFDSLANEKDLALPIAAWPSERIWERIQGIGDAAKPEAEPRSRRLTGGPRWRGGAAEAGGGPAKPKAERRAKVGRGGQERPPRARRPRSAKNAPKSNSGRADAASHPATRREQDGPGGCHTGSRPDLQWHCRSARFRPPPPLVPQGGLPHANCDAEKVTACCPSRSEGPFRQSSEEQSNSANSALWLQILHTGTLDLQNPFHLE